MMLWIPRASERCFTSTDLRVATTLGIAAMKVNQMETNKRTAKP